MPRPSERFPAAAHATPPLLPPQVKNPATVAVLADLPLMKGTEARAAVAAADAVFPQWSRLPAKERAAVLLRCAAACMTA